ncbi:hypothetical protein HDU96_009491 [Phlyctochytrium bullatum]|nr:hypothetical protein HDU96_009491 [Phlyctochytrium bullatum]
MSSEQLVWKPATLQTYVVGACYMDVILNVDAYPKEDTKTRAQSVEKRRGGNGGNLLTVLSQLRKDALSSPSRPLAPELLASLPDLACKMVCVFAGDPPTPGSADADSFVVQDLLQNSSGISLDHCLFRGSGYMEPTAWIISTPASRTVINHTTVPEMTAAEFEAGVVASAGTRVGPDVGSNPPQSLKEVLEAATDDVWVHFEGRNVEELIKMIRGLLEMRTRLDRVPVSGWGGLRRNSLDAGSLLSPAGATQPSPSPHLATPALDEQPKLSPGLTRKLSDTGLGSTTSSKSFTTNTLPRFTISVEFEKSNRPFLDELLPLADVLFFSKLYAEGKGFPGAPTGFLDNIRRSCKPGAILFVTWSEHGAFGLINDPTRPAKTFHVPAPSIQAVVDTIGAGDTFAAGVIYALGARACDAETAARWACRLATAKCAQFGFDGVTARVPSL